MTVYKGWLDEPAVMILDSFATMSGQPNHDYAEFLKAKTRLLSAGTACPPDALIKLIDLLAPLTLSKAKSLDHETDLMMAAAFSRNPEIRSAIDAELKTQFGYSRLSAHPHTTARRIARTGAIANDDEARIVQDVLANVDDPTFKTQARRKLGQILLQYEQGGQNP